MGMKRGNSAGDSGLDQHWQRNYTHCVRGGGAGCFLVNDGVVTGTPNIVTELGARV